MQNKPADSAVPVQALIASWRESQWGRYGLATILSADAPAEKAFFAISDHATEPELNEAFECSIQLVRGKWRVVRMACDKPPEILELTGAVVEKLEGSGLPKWEVRLSLADGSRRSAQLDSDRLKEAKLAWIDDGTSVRVRVELPAHGNGQILALLEPTAASIITPDDLQPKAGYLAVSRKDWPETGKDDSKSLPFAVLVPGSGAWPLVWVKPEELRKQGIRAIDKVSLCEPFSAEAAEYQLEEAALVLQSGEAEELAGLVVEAIRVELRFDARRQAWNFKRLRAPLSLREPVEDGETIEWVQARVCELHPNKKKDDKDDGAERHVAKVAREPAMRVSMDIDDSRIGRGKVNGFLSMQQIRQGGLEQGVRTVVTLVSREEYWNIRILHRSTPKREAL